MSSPIPVRPFRTFFLALVLLIPAGNAFAGCADDFTVTASPPAVNGMYPCGQTVTFCVTIDAWDIVDYNWFHSIVIDFGPGWDMSTLVPGTPPGTEGPSNGTWGWYTNVVPTSTSGDNQGPVGPGFFFDLDNDGNPGDNFGDNATGSWTFCWTISTLSGPACIPGMDVSVVIHAFSDSQTGSWGTGGCDDATIGTLPAEICPSAGNDNMLTVCTNGTPAALFPLLGPIASAGGTWSGPSATSGTYAPGVQLPGAYTYSIPATAGCPADQAIITVNEVATINAGTDATLAVCSSDAATNLLPLLGPATPGGTWTGPGGSPSNGTYDPAVQGPGVYTYSVTAPPPCLNDQATVTVTEQAAPDAGDDGTLSICSNGTATPLLASLAGAQPGGAWTTAGGAPWSGTYDPAVDATGTFTYTVTGIAPCTNDQATVSVTEVAMANAGADVPLDICSDGASTPLLPLLSGAAPGGAWNGPGGAPFNGTYDPATNATGPYTYTVTGTSPCGNDQATVTVTEHAAPNAGSDALTTLCTDAGPTLLFPLLTSAQSGGTWTTGGGAPWSGTYDPAVDVPGTFTYSVAGNAPCTNDQATITVQETLAPNAGIDGALTFCAQAGPGPLADGLNGADPGGTWTAPNGSPHGPTYDPATDGPGDYVYTVAGTSPCLADQATVTVTETTTPNAGTDGTLSLCTTSASVLLFNVLGGAQGGGSWTDPSGSPHPGTLDPAMDPAGIYLYTVAAAEPCLADIAEVTVTISTPPDAGDDGAATLCSQSAPIDLFNELITPTAGGSWTAPDGAAHSNFFDPATDPIGTYTYTLGGIAPCPADVATVTVGLSASPNAGGDGATTLCTSSTAVDLFTLLSGADAGGTWTAPDGSAHSNLLDPAVDAAGTYTYTIAAAPPCAGDVAEVTITISTPPDAGDDGAATLCSQSAPIDLFNELTTPTAGGSWTAPDGAAHSNFFDPATDPTGTYTYTLGGTAPCPADAATVTVGLSASPNAGIDGATTLCTSSAAVDLFTLLSGADAGGTWTAPDGSAHSNLLDPAVDAAGTYTYTIAAAPPCAGDVAEVTITINTPPDAGSDGAATLCSQSAPVDLFNELVAPTAGGSWTAPDGSAHNNFFDPAVDAVGTYAYTLGGDAPCPADVATVTVGLSANPNAGIDGATTLCTSSTAVDLFTLLSGADAGGTWTAPDGSAHSNLLDPAVDAAGTYTYTIAAAPPCAGDVAEVTITINTPPDAGDDGSATLCAQSDPVDLFNELITPTAGGSWTAPDGAAHSNFFDPDTDPIGTYTYTLGGTAPCPADIATVTVGLSANPNAGGDGATTLCTSSTAVDLFSLLTGPDAGGTWTAPDGSAHSNLLDPAVDAAGTYTYTIAAAPPCAGDMAEVVVSINTPPDAGDDGGATLCAQSDPIDLFNELITPTAGGSWTAPDGSAHSNFFDPAVDAVGTYAYTLGGDAPCPADAATVTVGLSANPNAGIDGATTLCTSSTAVDLFTLLTGPDAGGTWTAPDGSAHSNLLDPAVDAAGTYIYTIAAAPPCAGDVAEVTITINAPPNAGEDVISTACDQGGAVDLFLLLGIPFKNGSWTGPDGLPHAVLFDPLIDAEGIYTYTLPGLAPCPSDAATVTMGIASQPDAGTSGTLELCDDHAPADLFAALGGTPDAGGTWAAPSGDPHSAMLDPGVDGPGNYVYTVMAPAPCPSASSIVTVIIQTLPDAGSDGTTSLCASGTAVDLFMALNGTPGTGGTWTDPSGAPTSGLFDPISGTPGAYTYTVAGTAPCPARTAVVQVSVVDQPDAGSDGALVLCENSAPIMLDSGLGGAPDPGGTWHGPSGTPSAGALDPAIAEEGTYAYVVSGDAPCINDTARVAITIHPLPTNGLATSLTLCASSGPFDPFTGFNGNAWPGGSWTSPSGDAVIVPLDPATAANGTYTYTVQGEAPCPNGTNTVLVQVDAPPTAGEDGTLVLCASGATVQLFDALGGTPDGNGTWTSPANAASDGSLDPATGLPGTYSYGVPANGACLGDEAVVEVTIHQPADAGADQAVTWCENAGPQDPLLWLGGAPQGGGTWTGPSGLPFAGAIDPAVAMQGAYTYLVPGTAPCPNASAVLTLSIDALPHPGTSTATALCPEASPFALSPLLGTPWTAGGTWTAPDGQPVADLFDPASMASGVFTYAVEGSGACAGNILTSSVAVTVHPSPSAAFVADTTIGCIPLTVVFHALDGSIASVAWDFDEDGSFTGNGTVSHTFDAAGTYSIHALVTDTNGCTATASADDLIFVQPPPVALFSASPDPTSTNAPTVTFLPERPEYPAYAWTIDGDAAGSGAPWAHGFPDAIGGEYLVCLTVTDAIGCTATYCDPVLVQDALGYIVPNAFSPDGDGLNDGFAPVTVGADPDSYTFFVFDRWGMRVFESHTVGEQWDGTMANGGRQLPSDVYVWRLLIGDRFSSFRKEQIGHVTLVR